MKSSMKGLFVILVIVMSFVAVQSVCAETVEGTIDSISTRPNKIVVDGTEVYGVMFNYLANKYNIALTANLDVSVEVYEYLCDDGTTKLKACEITVHGETVVLRPCQ